MSIFSWIYDSTAVKVIVGSAFFWAWFDALFMSAFFIQPGTQGLMSEVGAMAVFGLSVPVLVLMLLRQSLFKYALANSKPLLAFAGAGTAGSLLLLVSSLHQSWPLLFIGGILGGIFMAVFGIGWGAAYCHEGARSATPYVAGGFALAGIIDIPLLLMIPTASAIFFSLLPLLSGICFITISQEKRTYRFDHRTPDSASSSSKSLLRIYLGISSMLLGALILVILGFGYMQHLTSFSTGGGTGHTNGILIQVCRGITAFLMFIIIIASPRKASTVYRIGLLAMIAGFMMMPFLFDTDLFIISGAIIISGYTAFDLLVWSVFSQVAYAQSKNPLRTIAVMRLIVGLCYVIGATIGIVLVGNDDHLSEFVSAETTVVGYLVVIATVLLLSSEDVWALFRGLRHPSTVGRTDKGQKATPAGNHLAACSEEFAFTEREREIAVLLIQGRTQPWIADSLNISEHTVGTHVRHLYQKTDVHSRQEFIDLISPSSEPPSPE